jgi:hypothetical protein
VVSFTPRPLYPQGKNPWHPLDRRLGGPQGRYRLKLAFSTCVENSPLPLRLILFPIYRTENSANRGKMNKYSHRELQTKMLQVFHFQDYHCNRKKVMDETYGHVCTLLVLACSCVS